VSIRSRLHRGLTAAALVGALIAVGMPRAHAASSGRAYVPADTITAVASGLSTGRTSALVNLTMPDGAGPGYVTADRCASLSKGPQAHSTANYGGSGAVANLAVVPIDATGAFCLYNQSAVQLVADVLGSFGPAGPGGLLFAPTSPTRLLDSRVTSAVRLVAGSITRIDTRTSGAKAVLANLTMLDGVAPGYVTAEPCGTLAATGHSHSNGNHPASAAIANLSVIALDPDGSFCVFNQTAVHLVIDMQGVFSATASPAFGFEQFDLFRALDTRVASGVASLAAGSITRVTTASAGALAALINLTMVDGASPGYVVVAPCSKLTGGPHAQSNGNHGVGAASANLAVVPLDADGSFCVFNQSAVNVLVDVQGAFRASAVERFFPSEPVRVLDTRPPVAAEPKTLCESIVHIGDSTSVGLISPSFIQDPSLRIDAQYRRVGVNDARMEISGARSIVEGLPGQVNARDAAANQRSAGYRGCWAFAMGTTDAANIAVGSNVGMRERIDRMMAVANGEPVLWINVRTLISSGAWANANMLNWNAALLEATSRYSNLRVYDWAAASEVGWFQNDGIHYTGAGYVERGRLIANALAEAFPR
jgi:hypothetical protein